MPLSRMTGAAAATAVALGFGLGLGLVACADSTGLGSGQARLTVLITDSPAAVLDAAEVMIGEVHAIPADGPPIVLTDYAGTYDLLQLQDGVTEMLASADMEPGRLLQLRLIVEGALVTLADGYQFTDGSTTRALFVPSGAQTGIKVNLRSGDGQAGIDVLEGETVVVLDFDVAQSFVIQGNPNTPAGIQGILFTPVIRAVLADVAGSIAGVVSAPAGIALDELVVYAHPQNGDPDEPAGTATPDEEGNYRIHFLAPGSYVVTVGAPDGHHSDPESQAVTVGADAATRDVEDVDFEIVEDA